MVRLTKCLYCGKKFVQKTSRHVHCSRKCFKKALAEKKSKTGNPVWICVNCGKKIQLDFSPVKEKRKWATFQCPFCGHKISKCD